MPERRRVVPLPPNWADDLPSGFLPLDGYGTALVAISSQHVSYGGVVGSGQATYASRVTDLVTWATGHNYTLVVNENTRPTIRLSDERTFRVPGSYTFSWYVLQGREFGQRAFTVPADITCARCGETHSGYTVTCPNDGEMIMCLQCGGTNVIAHANTREQYPYGADYWCDGCGFACQYRNCSTVFPPHFDGDRMFCNEHGNYEQCRCCGRALNWNQTEPNPFTQNARIGIICDDCNSRACPGCNRVVDTVEHLCWSDTRGTGVCVRCLSADNENVIEFWDSDDTGELGEMPTIPGRENVRLCGIEVEGDHGSLQDNGQALAREFYAAGLSATDRPGGYHSGDLGFAKVEHDSSVDWEAVLGPMNIADPNDVGHLNQAMDLIRAKIHSKEYKLSLRAGLHIHVSGEKVSLGQAYNLSHLFSYIEDPFFRIAAAHWPMHRSCQGNAGSRTLPKHNRKREFLRSQGGSGGGHDDHYYALSFANYFSAMLRRCECGAVRDGVWDECTCPLGKCTFEFRLFNTTANMRKLHAYLALSQALVAKAIEMPEIKDPATEFPGLSFNRRVLKSMSDEERETLLNDWRPRLAFMLNDLPLTDEEREAVFYCIRHSEIATGLGSDLDGIIRKEKS